LKRRTTRPSLFYISGLAGRRNVIGIMTRRKFVMSIAAWAYVPPHTVGI
jgi:hypothetical protein